MRLRGKITALALSVLGCISILGSAAYAAGTVKTSDAGTAGQEMEGKEDSFVLRDGSLTIRTFESRDDGGKPINGVDISIYRIAEINEDGKYTAVSEFADVLKDAGFEDLSALDLTFSDANSALRKALSDHIGSDGSGAAPSAEGKTENGTVTFDIAADRLGLYFVRGGMIENYFDAAADGTAGKLSYIPDTALAGVPSPPNKELKTNYWDYIPTVNLKYTKGGLKVVPPVLKTVKVMRGILSGTQDFRFVLQSVNGAPLPDGQTVVPEDKTKDAYVEMTYSSELAEVADRNGAVTRPGTPKEFGGIWFSKPGLYEYLLYEVKETARHYTFDEASYRLCVDVEVAEDGTLKGTQWYEKIEGGTVTETSDKVPVGQDTQFTFRFTNTYSRNSGGGGGGGGGGGRSTPGGGNNSGGGTPSHSGESGGESSSNPEPVPGVLPKTGMLWWPVPLLASAGIVLFAAGYILERRKN